MTMTSNSKHGKWRWQHLSSQSIPISGISRSNSELEDLAQAELLADYRDGQMYERIMTGILRRSGGTGTYHPKTLTSLNNIIHTKMLDYASISEDRRSRHPMRIGLLEINLNTFIPTRSSALKSETLDGSTSSLSCFSTTPPSSDLESEAEDSGIFEFEL
ncbi:hypothetical protein QTG54_012829 [Skeletonema marinoi]|uniref:Uncharacterized protein n=1 Tax=Skeletonema marinoi TaxID=267567 RepID=A0AAD9D815_9STRA|nr:hypothetical protein QTG54_012829 [Skeletonema marinoi]